MSAAIPQTGRLLGIDFGTVRVGVAVCDEGQSIASPLDVYTRRNEKLDGESFIKLAHEIGAVGIVVGLPIHMSGDDSENSAEAREYGQWLESVMNLPVDWIDERFSTARARELLNSSNLSAKQRKARLDKIAAQAILMSYLESNRQQTERSESIDD